MNLPRVNVADRLADFSAREPDVTAVVDVKRGASCTFGELDADASALARGLIGLGVQPQTRLALLVPPGVEFVKLVFALLRCGATTVLVDPGMGRKHLVDCLAAADPEGFIAISKAQAVRTFLRNRFPKATLNVTLGRRWFWGGVTYKQLLRRGRARSMEAIGSAGEPRQNTHQTDGGPPPEPVAFGPPTHASDPAAIIFTSGSTGPPKGVRYTHRMFDAQASEIQRAYDLQAGGVDLACFALFGLFNSAMGVTTVFPEMNFSRPASADPRKLLAAANGHRVTQAFASPAVWDKLSRHCERSGERIPSLGKVFSCGAPVHADVLRRTTDHVAGSGAQMHTPYGATEALPVSTIEAREVLVETAALTSKGAGVCVGRKFDSVEWRVIAISDQPLKSIDDAKELPPGEIGELIVRGPQVSTAYVVGSAAANAAAKIPDGDTVWHRMGDVGHLDAQGRFWYQGRKSQRVETGRESLFTERCEAVFRGHPAVRRCALVGDGGRTLATPIIVVESSLPVLAGQRSGKLSSASQAAWEQLAAELFELAAQHECTAAIGEFLLHPSLPVDVRHNSKINREQLAVWATQVIADHKLRPHRTRPHVLSIKQPSSPPQPPA
jgi:olefin beta-lactone synthetase